MFCAKCGNTLADNAKFCPNCGNAVSTPNVEVGQQPVTMTAPVQQPVYAANPNMIQPKNNTMKIFGGITVAVLIVVIISISITVSEQNEKLRQIQRQEDKKKTEETLEQMQRYLDIYEENGIYFDH